MKTKDIILKAMLLNQKKEYWTAKDFQYGDHFVGYEASARMSEIQKDHPEFIKSGKEGKYRTLSIDWNYKDIEKLVEEYAKM